MNPQTGFVVDTIRIRQANGSYKVTFPPRVSSSQIIDPGDLAFWGYDNEHHYVVVSRLRDPIKTLRRYEYVSESSVDSQRVATVPKEFFHDYVGPYRSEHVAKARQVDAQFQLQPNIPYVVVTTPVLLVEMSMGCLLAYESFVNMVGQPLADRLVQDASTTPSEEDAQ